MDLSFRALFHRFQIIFDRIRQIFYVATETKSRNAIKYSPEITAVLGDRAHKQAPRESERTLTYQALPIVIVYFFLRQ